MKDQDYIEQIVPYTDEDVPESPAAESDELTQLTPDHEVVNDRHHLEIIEAPVQQRKRRSILKCSKYLLGLLVVGGLVLVLLIRISHKGSTWRSTRPVHDRPGHNKKPSKPTKAVPYKLNFPVLYPEINTEASAECQAAWGKLTEVPCHDKLFDRGNDNGTFRYFGWDPMYFLPKICTEECRNALKEAHSQLSSQCSPDDSFVIDNYRGMFNATLLESGPTAALETLIRRTNYQCRSSPNGDSDYEHCPTEMYERFSIIDGMNANLLGIDSFIQETDRRRIDSAQWKKGKKGTSKYSYNYKYKVREQRYGPGNGETSCDWCTFDYLNSTLSSWAEGKIRKPHSDQTVSLPEFIRRVRTVGARCAPTKKFEKIYSEALERYQASGALSADWETTLPSGDLDYLILNGPSAGDPPVSTINTEIKRLEDIDGQEDRRSRVCLEDLANRYTSAKCYINLSKEKLVSMMEKSSKKLRAAYCDEDCSRILNADKASTCDGVATTAKTRELLDDFIAATVQRDSFCSLAGKEWPHSDCAQALLSMGKADWTFQGRPKSPDLINDVGQALEKLKEKLVPKDLLAEFEDNPDVLPKDRDSTFKRETQLRESVCATCVWNWLAGLEFNDRIDYISTAESTSEYVDFVKGYYKTCTALGAKWLGDMPYGDDPAIWRVKTHDGNINRYIEVKDRKGRASIYGVNEATGSVHYYDGERTQNRPGVDIATLWHVSQAERGVIAASEDRFEEWKMEEERHRKEEDEKIWEVDDSWFRASASYIGPVPLVYEG